MTAGNYRACLDHVLRWEGGYVDHPRDPGGATNHGITRATLAAHRGRAVSKQDVRNLTIAEAGEIYRPKYWNKVKGDQLPDGMDLVAFDGGVNSGPSRGVRWLQKGLGVAADGAIGPVTLEAAQTARTGVSIIQRACAARMGFLQKLGTWSTFGRGWARRVADTEATAVAMYSRSADVVAGEAERADKAKATQATGATGTAAGGAGTGLLDLPEWAFGGVIAVAVVIALFMALSAAQHARRAAAYRAKQRELANG
ncbi:glycoside hydrolase family 108 protein [Donghicola eburneus]|uniref:glycoside hydrolase family 108 protein n=1 Tax=Donghicola eburneus TaxID=393278 RepID=UPI0008DFB154|nr:glycosyl hydrolase 108 family protein [Donghicola eburneus]SFQ52600.1 Lysozyme family protein [Donghicola eburneus]